MDLASETVFGARWTRPGLDLKTHTLITVVSDVSTGREAELAIHLRMARRQGWSEDELIEALLHLLGYVGAPLVPDAELVVTKVFAELRAEGSDFLTVSKQANLDSGTRQRGLTCWASTPR